MSLERLKAEYQKQKQRVDQAAADPDSAEGKRQVRAGGAAMIVLAVLVGLINVATWHFSDEIYLLFVAVPPVLLICGLIGLVTGKLPGKRR